jgi:tRNA A-37 threonylcarbamoyl transferase component Bud32
MALQILREAAGARRQFDPALLPASGIATWLEQQGRILKEDPHSRVALAQIEGRCYYLKLYLRKSALQELGFRLGRGRALRAFDAARVLTATEVAVPRAWYCLRGEEGLLLITEGVEGGDLKSLWQGHDPAIPQLVQAAGLALAHLHIAGYTHGDCKWSNLLCRDGRILFADLEAVARGRPGSRAAARDLARFTLNAEDLSLPAALYETFLTGYCAATRQTREAVVRATLAPLQTLRRRHLARYGPRGHPLLGAGQGPAGRA